MKMQGFLRWPASSLRRRDAVAVAGRAWLVLGLSALAACQNLPPAQSAVPTAASRGQAFAQRTCGGCHETGLYGSSSNPNAPPFGAIANQEGVTAETMSYWLRSAHNYPVEMDFLLHDQDVDTLVAYFVSLRDPHYRRPSD